MSESLNEKNNNETSGNKELVNPSQNETSEIIKLLKDIKDETEQQKIYVKKRLIISYVTCSVSLLILIVCALVVVPRVVSVCNQASDIIAKSSTLLDETSTIAENIKSISDDLSELELEKTFYDMGNLVNSSEKTVSAALDKIDSIDVETLNKSIKDLSTVVSPLARLFGK